MILNTPMPGKFEQRFGSDIVSWTVADIVADEDNKRLEKVYIKMYLHEDNQAAIQVFKTGRNPTMRHLGRRTRSALVGRAISLLKRCAY